MADPRTAPRDGRTAIAVITLGCSKNTVDSEVLMHQIEANALRLVEDPADADTVIINTCGFIDAAKEESVNTILEAAELKRRGRLRSLYVCGCLSERYREDLRRDLPEVDAFFGVTDFRNILETLGGSLRHELLGERHLTTPRHYAYLKIAEGCDRPCAFCAIPLMRGAHVSRPHDEVLREARLLTAGGTRELVLIAQDTTSYGRDLGAEQGLARLLAGLADVRGAEWIRLMYAYPAHFPLDILPVMREHPVICRYLDMPVQHINDEVLRSMRRGITRRATLELLERIRAEVPGIALRTTLIVGYPNESDAAFRELHDFVREARFERLGVFTYSQEENTVAHLLGDPVPAAVKEERRDAIMDLQRGIALEHNDALVGQTLPVLFDRVEGEHLVGRTESDAPEVDNEVLVPAAGADADALIGSFARVTIDSATEYDLHGRLAAPAHKHR